MNLNEDNIFSFVYQKTTSEKKNQTQPDIKFPNKLPTEDLTDILKKNTEALEISLKKNINQKKERNSKSQKIKNNKNRKKQKQQNSSYKNGIADEEINYLFTLLKDGNLDIITEITLRKALNNCGMTDIEDEFVKKMLNIFKTKEELDEDNKNEEETNTFSIDLEKFNKLYRECKITKK